MSAPEPYTDEELERLRNAVLGFGKPFTGGLFDPAEVARLLATVDALRAQRRDDRALIRELAADLAAARADRVCWRETHNQVAAERDALAARAEKADADALLHHRCHTAAIERWHETCDAVLNAVIEHGALRSVVEVVAEWLEGSDALDDEVCDLIRRALDASPTEGNPDE